MKETGYNCKQKHLRYEWPSLAKEHGVILSDSLLKNIRHLPGTRVVSIPGAKFRSFRPLLRRTTIVKNSKVVFICLGTNDAARPVPAVLADLLHLVECIRQANATCKIVVGTILPRLDKLASAVHVLNREIARFIKHNNLELLRLHNAILKTVESTGIIAKDKLHLDKRGVMRVHSFLRDYLRSAYKQWNYL